MCSWLRNGGFFIQVRGLFDRTVPIFQLFYFHDLNDLPQARWYVRAILAKEPVAGGRWRSAVVRSLKRWCNIAPLVQSMTGVVPTQTMRILSILALIMVFEASSALPVFPKSNPNGTPVTMHPKGKGRL